MTNAERKQAVQAKKDYRRNWRKRNPEKVKAAQERYWLKVAQKQGAKHTATTDGKKKVYREN